MYKILIITLLFFIPLSSFSQSPETCSLIQNSESNVPDNMPLSHIDFSNCNLVGLDLNDRNLSNPDFSGANLSGAYFFGSNLENTNFKNEILYG